MEALSLSVTLCSTCRATLNANGECVACLLRGGLNGPTEESVPRGDLLVFGDFEIAQREDGSAWELGRGAMGVTYLAVDKVLHRSVALKVIEAPAVEGGSQAVRERSLREARAAAGFRHPNVAGVFQFGALPEADRCYYAMELVEGETLEARVRRGGPLEIEPALQMAIQVTRALMAASAQGLIHRDLKPSNIMLTRADPARADLEVKVIDFGLAKAIADAATDGDGAHGGFVGTPAFASPEQFRNDPADGRSDIYSLGVTLWYALAGEIPWLGKTSEQIRERQIRALLPVERLVKRGVPEPLIGLLRSMLAPDPAERPASAQELMKRLASCHAQLFSPNESNRRLARPKLVALAVVVGLVATGLLLFEFGRARATNHPAVPPIDEKSIAVLPFETLDASKEDEFFADGIQDDVLTSLGKIKELTVIARPSVAGYRGAHVPRKLREIGQALQVSHVLEGSVRRFANHVVINVELIDTRTQRQVWSERYDRNVDDVLTLQGQLAGEIATALRATLGAAERALVEKVPTKNVPAYEAYLRGLAAEGHDSNSVNSEDCIRAYGEAVKLDPQFALAWAKLSIAQSLSYWMNWDRTAARLAASKKALEKAGSLAPDTGEFYLARGYYHYRGEKNYEAAIRDFEEAKKRLPNSADALVALGFIDRRVGRWEEALTHFSQAARLDPRNIAILGSWGATLGMLRRFDEERALLDRQLEIDPNDPDPIILKAWTYQAEGDLEKAAKLLQPLPLQPFDSSARQVQLYQWLFERRYPQLIAESQSILRQPGLLPDKERGRALAELGHTQELSGDKEAARASFLEARDLLERERQRAADDNGVATSLAFAYAGLGEREAALHEAERGVTITANDLDEPDQQVTVAEIYAQFGDAENAVRDLPRLLRTPGCYLTPGLLRLDPGWDPIRKDARFAKLASSAGTSPARP